MELELSSTAASVAAARRSAGEFAQRVGASREDVELAVSEAVTNSVMHAYPDGESGTITVRAEQRNAGLVVTVADDGTGLRPNISGRGLGVGIPLIAQLCEEYRLEDGAAGGAVVTMLFSTGGEE
jgi:serine/threonine-protein kinase RsbW/stage II sporulation protein AB (anti-sigma F factor)